MNAQPQLLLRSLLATCFLLCSSLALAEAPQQKSQVPGYYRMQLGQIEVTALYDGAIKLDTKLLKNSNEKEVQQLLARLFVKGPAVQTAVNAYLINTGSKLVLVDAVLATHLHGDHVNGLIDADGKAVFANAEIWAAQADHDFWLSEEVAAQAPKEMQGFFKMALDAAAPYRAAGKWKTFASDHELLPGISSLAAHGHTPGHSAYLIGSGEEKLLIWGDLVHNHAVQFARPQVAIEFDVDRQAAVATRKQIFARAAKEKLLVGGMHLPFPGIGHVRKDGKDGKGYSWVPVEFAPLP